MKRTILTFVLSYVLTLVTLWVAYLANHRDGSGDNTSLLTQRLALRGSTVLTRDEDSNGLPFSWLELSKAKSLNREIQKQIDPAPRFQLRQDGDRLLLEVWELLSSEEGARLAKRLQSEFPIIRRAFIAELQKRGLEAEPVGDISVQDYTATSVSSISMMLLLALVFIPSFVLTAFLNKGITGPNKSLEPTLGGVTPAAAAPGAPPPSAPQL
jgi:hypothetical protein